MNKNNTVTIIARNGIIAALYVGLTLASFPLSYGMIQFRISEILVLLCFFRKDYTVGLTLGCAIANIFSPELGLWDVLIGTGATLIACLGICFCKILFVAALIPVVANALLVGFELSFILGVDNFWVCAGFVGLGEFVVLGVGYGLFMFLKNKKYFMENVIGANQNLECKF